MNSDQVKATLQECAQIVEDAELPGDLRPTAFRVLLTSALWPSDHGAVENKPGSPRDAESSDVGSDTNAAVSKIAKRLTVEVATAARIFDVDTDGLHLQIARGLLPEARKAAQQEVALLIAAGRQAGGLDAEWTQLKLVREACDDLGVLDSPNFARAINALSGNGVRIRESKELKVNQVGYERATEIVTRMVGGAS